jgi:integrase
MILWLNEAGRPMTSAAWAAVFRRASMRCRALGIDLDVTPHALRHYLPCLTMSSNADRDLRLLKNARIAAHQFTQSPDIVS